MMIGGGTGGRLKVAVCVFNALRVLSLSNQKLRFL